LAVALHIERRGSRRLEEIVDAFADLTCAGFGRYR